MSTLTLRPKPTLTVSLKELLVHHPFVSYFALAFAGTWLLDLPIVLGQNGLGLLPYHMPFVLYALIFLSGSYAGPTLAAVLMTAVLEGRAGVRHFFGRYVQWRVGFRWYLVILVGYPLFFLGLVSLGLGGVPLQSLMQHWSTLFTLYLPALLIFPAIINWGEEAGWRGFAQTRMQAEYGALRTSLLVGLLHGLWHLPAFLLVEGPAAMGPLNPWHFARNTLDIMLITVVWTWVFNNAQGSILIASLSHAAWNAAQGWIDALVPNTPTQIGTLSINDAATLIFLGCALLVIVASKGQLGYAPTATPLSVSVKVWLGMVAYLVFVKIIITFIPATFSSVEQAAVFAWPALGIWAVLGLIGIWFAHKTGFPSAWDGYLSNRQRLWIPIIIGLAYAGFEVVFDLLTGYSKFEIALHHATKVNIDFPANLLIYPGGAVIVEVVYRLFLIPVLLWLLSNVILKGGWQTPIFWALAILTSFIEPLTQDLTAIQLGAVMLAAVLLKGFGLNFLQASLFRKYGFLAAILMRVAFYLIWHVVYVH